MITDACILCLEKEERVRKLLKVHRILILSMCFFCAAQGMIDTLNAMHVHENKWKKSD